MPETITNPNQPNYKRRQRVAVGALAIGTGLAGLAAHDILSGPSYEEKVEAKVEADPTVLNAKVILHEGVKLRSEPLMNNGDAGEPSNVLNEVKAGEVLVLDHPLVYTNQVNEEFIGAVDKEGNYFWVNAEALQDQESTSGQDYITYVDDQNTPQEEGDANFTDGRFYQGVTQESLAATASSLPVSEVENIYPDYK